MSKSSCEAAESIEDALLRMARVNVRVDAQPRRTFSSLRAFHLVV